jgi:hypothetical protein
MTDVEANSHLNKTRVRPLNRFNRMSQSLWFEAGAEIPWKLAWKRNHDVWIYKNTLQPPVKNLSFYTWIRNHAVNSPILKTGRVYLVPCCFPLWRNTSFLMSIRDPSVNSLKPGNRADGFCKLSFTTMQQKQYKQRRTDWSNNAIHTTTQYSRLLSVSRWPVQLRSDIGNSSLLHAVSFRNSRYERYRDEQAMSLNQRQWRLSN